MKRTVVDVQDRIRDRQRGQRSTREECVLINRCKACCVGKIDRDEMDEAMKGTERRRVAAAAADSLYLRW